MFFGKNYKENQYKDYIEKEIEELEIQEKGSFDINIEKGLFVGAGVPLIAEHEEELHTVNGIYIDWGDLAGHMSIYGTTRVGKTRLMVSIIRQCILRNMDILVIEPKGAVGVKKDEDEEDIYAGQETLAWILQFAEEANRLRDVRYISPKFGKFSLKFNPLYGLTNEEISSLVSTIIPADDEFFVAMGRQVTMAVLMGLEFLEKVEDQNEINEAIEKEYKKIFGQGANIVNAELNLSDPDLSERIMNPDIGMNLELITPPYRSLITFSDLSTYATQEGIQAILQFVLKTKRESYADRDIQEINEIEQMKLEAIKALTEMANKDKQYFSKVSSSFNTVMQQLSTGELGKILCTVKINPIIDRFYSERGQIIIVQPWPLIYKDASKAFVRIFFSLITSYLGNVGASGRALKREICLFVDEGGSVLYAGVEDLFNKAGGLGLRIFIFTQSFADYSSGLGEEVAAIVNDNTNIKIYMRMNDNNSRELVANSFGTVKKKVTKYMGSKLDMRVSSGMEDFELLTPAHMGDMQKQEFLLQYGEGRFYCCAPFQPDPNMLISMPEIHMEKAFLRTSKKYQPELLEN